NKWLGHPGYKTTPPGHLKNCGDSLKKTGNYRRVYSRAETALKGYTARCRALIPIEQAFLLSSNCGKLPPTSPMESMENDRIRSFAVCRGEFSAQQTPVARRSLCRSEIRRPTSLGRIHPD